MREILFRGKRLDSGEWVEGCLIVFPDEECFICSPSDEPDALDKFWVRSETVGQYTGLADKNGRKIFEGDVLRIARSSNGNGDYYFPPLEYPVKVVVKWDLCAWMWEILCKDKRYISFPDAWCHYECEVIGNAHDHPELLEE